MAEYVVKLRNPSDPGGVISPELLDALLDFKGVTLSPGAGEVRDVEHGELDAIGTHMAELRTAYETTDEVTYHLCRHDEGIGDCRAAVEIR
jgi:hypothetical protein